MRQSLLWMPPGETRKGLSIKVTPPVPYTGEEPTRVWTLLRERDEAKPPHLPFTPYHGGNAFLEDYMHDWNIWRGCFRYASRVCDGGVWLLLEFK